LREKKEMPNEIKKDIEQDEKAKEQQYKKELSKKFDLSSENNNSETIKISDSIQNADGKVSKIVKAKDIAIQNAERFFYTSENQAYVKIDIFGNSEIVSTLSNVFGYWLTNKFEAVYGGVLSKDDIRKTIQSIDSTAYFKGYRREIYVRIAEVDGAIYIDLCNDKREVLKITADGFEVIDDSPILFRRTQDMEEIPKPIYRNADDYKLLNKYINTANEDDFNMIIAYLLGAFRSRMPKPILNLIGEAGTGKSMNTRLIRKFIDPAKQKDLLKKEINEVELPTASDSQYLLAFDNLSGITAKGSDLLCVVSTGGAMTKRKLYTDKDEIIIDLKKTVILNGIDDISKKQDLVSRTIFIETPPLQASKKKTETEIWSEFEKDYPYILGSLVHAVSTGLKNKGNDQSSYPRMIDFGRFIQDCSEALDWGKDYWKATYVRNQTTGVEQSIESDPFASSLVIMLEDLASKGLYMWRGTATELLETLSDSLPHDETTYNKAWPKSNQVKPRLRRIAPAIKEKGIEWSTERSNGRNLITVEISM